MKMKFILASSAMIFSISTAVMANPFTDVPFTHWAYDAVKSLSSKGMLKGYPDGTFKGEQPVNRYQLAVITATMMANSELMGDKLSGKDSETLEKLTVEFADELALLGVKNISLEDDMQLLKKKVSGLKNELNDIKSSYTKGEFKKVRLSGDVLVRNTYAREKDDADSSDNNRTSTQLRLQIDAQIDENVKAVARWIMVEDQGYRNGTHSWDGNNRLTGDVDTAYLEVKDMFKLGGDFIFGRRRMFHGHNLLVNSYEDVVSCIKHCGDVDLALNLFFNRDSNGNDCHNMFNVNADTRFKGHDIYLGLYYQTVPAVPAAPDKDNEKLYSVELGSNGDLGNNGFWSYDLGVAYTSFEDGKYANAVHFTDRNSVAHTGDAEGVMLHGALKWDSKEEWAAKVAYTMVDEEAFMNGNMGFDYRYEDSPENPLEDIFRASAFDRYAGPINNRVTNTQDVKVQIEYSPKRNGKYYIRLAYDMVEAKNSSFSSTFFNNAAGVCNEADVFTFEYRYRIAENTRIRLGYTNFQYGRGNDVNLAVGAHRDFKMAWTEIFSRF